MIFTVIYIEAMTSTSGLAPRQILVFITSGRVAFQYNVVVMELTIIYNTMPCKGGPVSALE